MANNLRTLPHSQMYKKMPQLGTYKIKIWLKIYTIAFYKVRRHYN